VVSHIRLLSYRPRRPNEPDSLPARRPPRRKMLRARNINRQKLTSTKQHRIWVTGTVPSRGRPTVKFRPPSPAVSHGVARKGLPTRIRSILPGLLRCLRPSQMPWHSPM
jgi:hypothetical protein